MTPRPGRLLDILLAGDLNPTLRSELPGAMRSALRGDTRPLLRLLLRAEGLTGIPDARAQGAARRGRLRCALRGDALRGVARSRGTAPPAREQRAGQARGRRPSRIPATDFQPFNYKIALRSESIPLCVAWPNASPAAGAAGAAAGRAHARSSRAGSTCARRSRTRRRRRARSRGAQLVAVPLHRPLGRDQRPQRLRARTRSAAFFAGQPRRAVPERRAGHRAVADRADAAVASCPGARRATKTIAAVDGDGARRPLQFLGDEIAAGRATPRRLQGRRRCAPATRRVDVATATTCAGVEYVPGVTVNGAVPAQQRARRR